MSHQMNVTLQELSRVGKAWQWNVSASLLMDVDSGSVDALVGVCCDAPWQGEIQREHDRYVLHGQWSVAILRRCDRCMDEFEWHVSNEVERVYALEEVADMDDEESADIDILQPPGLLNLLDVLREEVWLAWKPCVICKDTCQGLCQGCGVNLSQKKCECEGSHEDHPFAALAKMKFDT